MKKALKLIVFLSFLFTGSALFAQVTAEMHGVSPRQTLTDTLDIFDVAFNANPNTGVETKMYLKGSSVAGSWNILSQPVGSTAIIGASETGEDYQVVVFTTDVVGTYLIEFTDGSTSDTLTINAGTYKGMDGGNCAMCHNENTSEWEGTGHSDMFVRALEGTLSSHYASYCLSCHVVGYDQAAANDGFDDFDFVFPDSLYLGVYDLTVAAYPDAMARANIQCESCHGPGSEHFGNVSDNKMTSSLDAQNCAWCHDSGDHHYFPAQWRESGQDVTVADSTRGFHGGHAIGTWIARGTRGSCAPCHSGAGYVQWDKEGKPVNDIGLPGSIATVPDATVISCAVCHDPHDATNLHQLRLSNTQLGDGTPVTFALYGTGAQCMECHRSRREAATYSADPSNGSSHYGPHHGPQADMLIGANGPDFGIRLPSSPHAVAPAPTVDPLDPPANGGMNSCVNCHMSGDHAVDAEGNVSTVGGHSFNMNDALGNDNVEACEPCHGNVGTTFTEKKYFMNSNADHDGDGNEEGVQEEVHGMMANLLTYLPTDSLGHLDMSSKTNSIAVLRAGYVYLLMEEDRSFGIHNPAYSVGLLKAAIESMKYGSITAGAIQSVLDIPMDQGYQVRVVWTKFGADDGVSLDQVSDYTILRLVDDKAPKGAASYSSISEIPADIAVGASFILASDLWDVVAVVPATQFTEYAAVVPTLYNTIEADTAWATFKVLGKTESGIIAETDPMKGFSVDDLAPLPPTGLAAEVTDAGVLLNWNEAYDKDVENFDVYRNVDTEFNIETAEYLGSTRNLTFTDASPIGEVINYSITAVDYSMNVSDIAPPVSVIITDVAEDMDIPTEFELFANYPNPFNPSTQIKFGLPQNSDVRLTVYDAVGKEVTTLINERLSAGYHVYTWNAINSASGIYFYQIQTNSFVQVKKMVLVK